MSDDLTRPLADELTDTSTRMAHRTYSSRADISSRSWVTMLTTLAVDVESSVQYLSARHCRLR